jgi:hypothetical protein
LGTSCRYTASPTMQTVMPIPDSSDIGRRPNLQAPQAHTLAQDRAS